MACPASNELQAFAVGNLSTGALQRVERHIESCPGCQSSLEQFDRYRDGLVTELVRPATFGTFPVPEPVLASARAALDAAESPPPEVRMDSGRHYARLLEAGPCRLGRFE